MPAVSRRGSAIATKTRIALGTGLVILGCAMIASPPARASRSEWSIFEDHPTLVNSGGAIRQQSLDTIRALGADTLRIEVKWAEVAPSPGAKRKPSFTATDPSAYPGFEPYDDLVRRAVAMGFRVMMTLAPDAPRWATAGGRGRNYRISAAQFAAFAR